jgi:alpha-glucosidase
VTGLNDLAWWQKAVFYQIYPRSFADGNGDGIGDFEGMIAQLDYLQELGVDALWLSPHFPSPQFDCGYDVSDYTDVEPDYGTLDEFQHFLDGAHRRGMRVILDLVLNHTSDQHRWFQESRSSRDNPKRDWYVWRDGKDGGPPNNWYSSFGGSAWEHDAATDQYYYHFFLKQQPDLNWRNPQVKQAMWDAVRFWLDRGVDGFRLDAIATIFEHPGLPDQTSGKSLTDLHRAFRSDVFGANEEEQEEGRAALHQMRKAMFEHQHELPEVHDLMRELRAVVDEYPDRVLVGETDDLAYYGDGTNELHLVFNFPLMRTERLTPAWVRTNQRKRLAALPVNAWPCNTLGNHDSPRVKSRYGDGHNDEAIARLSLALVLTLHGTPFLYNGEEIGMTDLLLANLDQFRDLLSVRLYKELVEQAGMAASEAVALAARIGRDKCRTPLQWRNAPNAGFSPPGVETWLPVNSNYAQGINVADQRANPDTLLHFYRRMLALRAETPALIAGSYLPLQQEAEDFLAFLRSNTAEEQHCLVMLNMSERAQTVVFDAEDLGKIDAAWAASGEGGSTAGPGPHASRLRFSSHQRAHDHEPLAEISLAPFEIYIGELVQA